MDIEELKQQWNQLSVRVDRLEQENRRLAAELATGRAVSAQQKLVRRFMLHGFCGLILPLLAPLLVLVLNMPLWVAVLYALLGLVCMLIDFYLADSVRKRNIAKDSVVENLQFIISLKKKQRQIQLVLIGVCLLFLAFAFYPFIKEEPSIVIGAFIGAIIGATLGFLEYRRKIKLINEIIAELRESINPKDNR